MNTCDEMMVLLSARLDGALTEGEEAQLEEHLAQVLDWLDARLKR